MKRIREAIFELDQYLLKSKMELTKEQIALRKGEFLVELEEYDEAMKWYYEIMKTSTFNKQKILSMIDFLDYKSKTNKK